jgi:hypothetical protein
MNNLIHVTTCTSVCPTFGGSDPGIRAEVVHSLKEELSVMYGLSCSRHPSAFTSLSVSPQDLVMHLFLIEVFCCKAQTDALVIMVLWYGSLGDPRWMVKSAVLG